MMKHDVGFILREKNIVVCRASQIFYLLVGLVAIGFEAHGRPRRISDFGCVLRSTSSGGD